MKILHIGSFEYHVKHLCEMFDSLLPRLPKDSITEFRFGSQGRPSGDQLRRLWQNQKRLRNIQLDFNLLNPPPQELIHKDHDLLQALDCIEEINIDVGDAVDPTTFDEVLKTMNLRNLQKVELRLSQQSDSSSRGSLRQAATDSAWGRVFKTYFPAALSQLTLTHVYISDPRYLQLDGFPSLVNLELRLCLNVSPVLDCFRKPKLKRFHYCQSFSEELWSGALWKFLGRFDTLEEFVFQYRDLWSDRPARPSLISNAIAMHSQTLRILLLSRLAKRTRSHFDVGKPEEALQLAAEKCCNVQQLGLEFYGCTIDSDPAVSLVLLHNIQGCD